MRFCAWATAVAASVVLAACASGSSRRSERVAARAPALRFDRVLVLEQTSDPSANVSLGDLDGDGDLDVVLAKGRHWPRATRVLLNDGKGGFPVARDLGDAPFRSYSATLVDIDADGDLDVVLSNDAPDPKLVFLNDGKGLFTRGSEYGSAAWPTRNASVADLDGDRLPDIIVANRSQNAAGANYVCLNRGPGRFDSTCLSFSKEPATTITPADFNQDGFIDLAVPHRDGGQSYVYLNDGKAGFAKRIPFGPADAAIRVTVVADLNGDGRPDIVGIDERRGVWLYPQVQDGTFSAGIALETGKATPYALAVGDLNLDGKIDIVVGYVQAASTVFLSDGSGAFAPVPFGDEKGTTYGFAIGDVDRDGFPDIAVARSDAPNVIYFGER
jgi:hypothetical protein